MNSVQIIILLIALVGLIWLTSKPSNITESFNLLNSLNNSPYNYSRAYPGTFSYKYGYGSYYRPFYANRTNSDYWYIPAHNYLNNWMGTTPVGIPRDCTVPASTSEYCVSQRMQESGNLDLAIEQCTVPTSISESCSLLKN